MMSLTFGLFTQVSGSGPLGPLVNVSVCLMTSYPIQYVVFTFAPLGVVLKMYEDTKWHKFKTSFRLICRYYILISYVDFTDETRRLM